MSAANLVEEIKRRIVELDSNAKELPFGLDLDKNQLGQLKNGYTVFPIDFDESDNQIGRLTINQTFRIIFTESILGNTSLSDAKKIEGINRLNRKVIALYNSLWQRKPDGVYNVTNLNGYEPEIDDEQKFISYRFEIDILYQA